MITNSYAQIFDIEDVSLDPITNPNIYWKDINSILNNFEGHYIFNENGIELEIKLSKVENVFYLDSRYDLLFGEYKYSTNNNVLYNTLENMIIPYNDTLEHSIKGYIILTGPEYYDCFNCSENEKRVVLSFRDKFKNYQGYIIIQKTLLNNQNALKVYISYYGNIINPTVFTDPPSVPAGTYFLIKQ